MSDTDKPGSALEAVEAASQAEIDSLAEESAPEQSDSSSDAETEQPQLSAEPEEATIEPTDEGTTSEEETTQSKIEGYIPTDRHQAVLTKARREMDELKKSYEDRLAEVAWAEQEDRQAYLRAKANDDALRADPIAFYQQLQREIEAHPHLGPQAKKPAEFKMPEPDLVADDGRKVYSVDLLNQIREHDQAMQRAELAEMRQSLETRLEQREQLDHQREVVQQTYQESQNIMAGLREDPIFKEKAHEEALAKRFAEIPAEEVRRLGVYGAIERAKNVFYQKDYLPKVEKASKKQTVETLQKKAAAGSVDPASGTASAEARPRGVKQLEKRLASIAGRSA